MYLWSGCAGAKQEVKKATLNKNNMIKNSLTKQDESFIRKNYLTMHDAEIAEVRGILAYHVHQFRTRNKLVKKRPSDLRVFNPGRLDGRRFDIGAVKNWLA